MLIVRFNCYCCMIVVAVVIVVERVNSHLAWNAIFFSCSEHLFYCFGCES